MKLDPEDLSQAELEALLHDICGVGSLDEARRFCDLAADYFEDGDPFWHPTAVHRFAAAWLEFQAREVKRICARMDIEKARRSGAKNEEQK